MPKKVLITGASGQQCGRQTTYRYEIVSDVFARVLRDANVIVEHREYRLGEDLHEYDLVLLGLVPFYSVAGHYTLPAMRCWDAAEKSGVPIAVFVDDWRFWQFFNNIRSIQKNPLQLIKPFFDGRALVNEAREDLDPYIAMVERIANEPWPLTIAPAYAWGDHEKLASMFQLSSRTSFIDITPYLTRYPLPDPLPVKDRVHVLGTASNQLLWLEKQQLTWPVHHFGGRASKAPRQVTEAELAVEYTRHWGVLSPSTGYKTHGTGWWRSRFEFAARAEAILVCDPDEAPRLGQPYQNRVTDVEALSDVDLAELAAAQRTVLRSWLWKSYQVQEALLEVIADAKELVS